MITITAGQALLYTPNGNNNDGEGNDVEAAITLEKDRKKARRLRGLNAEDQATIRVRGRSHDFLSVTPRMMKRRIDRRVDRRTEHTRTTRQ